MGDGSLLYNKVLWPSPFRFRCCNTPSRTACRVAWGLPFPAQAARSTASVWL